MKKRLVSVVLVAAFAFPCLRAVEATTAHLKTTTKHLQMQRTQLPAVMVLTLL